MSELIFKQIDLFGIKCVPRVSENFPKFLLDRCYPVGSIYHTSSDRNPEEFLVGKWKRIAQGRVVVGQSDGVTRYVDVPVLDPITLLPVLPFQTHHVAVTEDEYPAESTGGEYRHQLTIDEMAKHAHGFNTIISTHRTGPMPVTVEGPCVGQTSSDTSSVGNDKPHNNMQPYVVKYIWERYE